MRFRGWYFEKQGSFNSADSESSWLPTGQQYLKGFYVTWLASLWLEDLQIVRQHQYSATFFHLL
jgi:hypothetical protein